MKQRISKIKTTSLGSYLYLFACGHIAHRTNVFRSKRAIGYMKAGLVIYGQCRVCKGANIVSSIVSLNCTSDGESIDFGQFNGEAFELHTWETKEIAAFLAPEDW